MLRVLFILVCLVPHLAFAGQASGSLTVSLTIGGSGVAAAKSTRSYTAGAAAISVSQAGFSNVVALDKAGNVYWFSALRLGAAYKIAVSALSGQIVQVSPV